MNIYEPGQDRNVAALSIMFMCGGFLNYMTRYETYMLEALKEAELAALEDEVPVGCVIVKNDQIIARAHNQRDKSNNPLGHAETLAIKQASEALNVRRASDRLRSAYDPFRSPILLWGSLHNHRFRDSLRYRSFRRA